MICLEFQKRWKCFGDWASQRKPRDGPKSQALRVPSSRHWLSLNLPSKRWRAKDDLLNASRVCRSPLAFCIVNRHQCFLLFPVWRFTWE